MKIRKERKWDIFKAMLDAVFKYFCVVVTVLIVVNLGHTGLSGDNWTLQSHDLVRILLMSLMGILPSFLGHVFIETTSAKGVLHKNITIFIITSVLVLGAHNLIVPSGGGITLSVIVTFLLVYGAVRLYSYFNATTIELEEKNTAMQINQRLNEIHSGENESHQD